MPELPEVETVRCGLAPLIEGKRIARFTLHRPDLRSVIPADMPKTLEGKRIAKTARHGKTMVWHIEGGKDIAWHLGMSGSFRAAKDMDAASGKHDHVDILLEDGTRVVFNDPRRFGNLTYAPKTWQGIDPLTTDFTLEALVHMMQGKTTPIKNLLLDQRLIAGIGNIYASEALFLARIHPAIKTKDVSRPKIKDLHGTVQQVLQKAIASGGSSLRNHMTVDGQTGYFQHSFAVYGRTGKPCPTCQTPVKKAVMAGRSTFFCPRCQSLKKTL